MSQDFVLDSSVALAWVFRDEATPETDLLLHSVSKDSEATAIVAEHWALEVTNVLLGAEKKRTTPADTANSWWRLEALRIKRDTETANFASGEILSLARTHGLTTYDAAYLELAMRRGLPLASLDGDLRKAAKKAGVAVLPRV